MWVVTSHFRRRHSKIAARSPKERNKDTSERVPLLQ